jgi:hypothetical protein
MNQQYNDVINHYTYSSVQEMELSIQFEIEVGGIYMSIIAQTVTQ